MSVVQRQSSLFRSASKRSRLRGAVSAKGHVDLTATSADLGSPVGDLSVERNGGQGSQQRCAKEHEQHG